MPAAQITWTIGLLALPLVVLFTFMRGRRRTTEYLEGRAVKARLPGWVNCVETLLVLAFSCLGVIAGYKLYVLLRGSSAGVNTPPVGASAVYVFLGLAFVILPIAMLCANAASWIIPFLRNANQEAFRGTGVSFKPANQGLIKFALVSVPFGMASLLIAVVEPWSR